MGKEVGWMDGSAPWMGGLYARSVVPPEYSHIYRSPREEKQGFDDVGDRVSRVH